MVQVFGAEVQRQLVLLHHISGIGKEEVGIGFQVYRPTVHQETAVTFHEVGRRQALPGVLHLRVAECQPYLLHLVWSEETVYYFNVGAQEGYILQPLFQGLCGTCPHPCSLDVDTDEVLVGVVARQFYGILSLAATQFEHDGVLVLEVLVAPVSLHRERMLFVGAEWILEHVLVRLHIRKLS